jgi:hypothetical protein
VSSRRSILKVSEGFRAAEVLADFMNLNPADSAAVTYFRNNYPDFAPGDWWDYLYRIDGMSVFRYEDVIAADKNDPDRESKLKSKVVKQWQHARDEIQKAWKTEFKFKSISEVSDLLKLVFFVDRQGMIWNSSVILSNGGFLELNTKLYDFHKAALYLQQYPRHAKICEECGKYFVHTHGKRTLCLFPDSRGETCAQKRINANRLKWWHEKGDKQRKAKKSKRKTKLNRGAHNNA